MALVEESTAVERGKAEMTGVPPRALEDVDEGAMS